jgi:hypothetical protein
LHIGFRVTTTAAATASDDDWAARFRQFLRPHEPSLRAHGLRRLTFTILPARAGDHPSYFTYRHSLDYDEVRGFRPARNVQVDLNLSLIFRFMLIWRLSRIK